MKITPSTFFNRPAPKVAHDLIGCILARKNGSKTERFVITETEAYEGFKDKASHASRGKTARNEVMFRSAGHIYVYFTYGMHWMLNIVTGPKDYPAAVLIRGGIDCNTNMPVNGPARLTKRLKINSTLNGRRLGHTSGLWIEKHQKRTTGNQSFTRQLIAGQSRQSRTIKRLPRVGVDYAGPVWSKKKWRFVLNEK